MCHHARLAKIDDTYRIIPVCFCGELPHLGRVTDRRSRVFFALRNNGVSLVIGGFLVFFLIAISQRPGIGREQSRSRPYLIGSRATHILGLSIISRCVVPAPNEGVTFRRAECRFNALRCQCLNGLSCSFYRLLIILYAILDDSSFFGCNFLCCRARILLGFARILRALSAHGIRIFAALRKNNVSPLLCRLLIFRLIAKAQHA